MDFLIDFITNPAVLTGLATVVTAVVPMIGLPAWVGAILTAAAATGVKVAEQTAKGKPSAYKKAVGMKAANLEVPLAVRYWPNVQKRLSNKVEAGVLDLTLDTIASDAVDATLRVADEQPEPPKRTRKKKVDKPDAVV